MTQYLEEVKKMGFNVVWINPIQKVGGKMFEKSSNQSGISYHVQ
jgi:glycosidase